MLKIFENLENIELEDLKKSTADGFGFFPHSDFFSKSRI
jgi:hypothetical protein